MPTPAKSGSVVVGFSARVWPGPVWLRPPRSVSIRVSSRVFTLQRRHPENRGWSCRGAKPSLFRVPTQPVGSVESGEVLSPPPPAQGPVPAGPRLRHPTPGTTRGDEQGARMPGTHTPSPSALGVTARRVRAVLGIEHEAAVSAHVTTLLSANLRSTQITD